MILGKSTDTLTSRQEHSLMNSLHLSTKPIKSIYNAYNYNFAAHFIAYKEYMYLHVTLKTPRHLWWKLSLHNKTNPYCYMYCYLDHLSRFIALSDR